MDPETHLTQVIEEDLIFIEADLASSDKPSSLRQLAEKLAYQKTASQRTQDIKKYDPCCLYEVGDQILKDYNEPLTVSSKTVEHFQGSVVLTIVRKTFHRAFQCEMLEVDYIGGGTFRRYIDYMKKSKTQVFLPSNSGQEGLAPELVAKQDDPRLTELPVTDKDLKTLERNLKAALLKSPVFFSWNDHWQLSRKQVDISEDKIKEAEALLQETGRPAGAVELVRKLFGLEPSAEAFDIHCLSLNAVLDKKYKKEFVFISPVEWGRWHLKKVLNAMPANLPLTAPAAKCPPLDKGQALEFSIVQSFPLKVYLTWREVLSGGIRVPRSIHKELSHSREYIFTDAEEGKSYPVYFFPNDSYFLGLAEFFSANNIPQGTSLTLERKEATQFQFWIKKSKKKIAVPQLVYDAQSDTFSDGGEVFTYALPNKSIFIEHEALTGLLALIPQRTDLDLHSLLILIFKHYSQEPSAFSLHFLRAFHLVDLLKQTTQEDVERVLLNSTQFAKSEKKKGVFYYKAPVEAKPEEEKKREKRPAEKKIREARLPAGEEEADYLPIGMIEEDFLREGEAAEEEEVLQVVAVEAPEQAPAVEPIVRAPGRRIEKPQPVTGEPAAPPAKKEKPAKKKPKIETERVPRARKSEKRAIEEKIEIEESELEALSAIKEVEGEAAEAPAAEASAAEALPAGQKEAAKADAPAEAPSFGGMFAEKLKSALKIKPEDKEKDNEKDKQKEKDKEKDKPKKK
jgi:hypothetical protein